MSWLSCWLKKGFMIKIKLNWPKEKNLSNKPMPKDKIITKEECEKEIRDSLNKGG